MNSLPTVSVLGLGNLGRTVAERFLEAGHRVTVWNRSAHRAERLRVGGAVVAADPAAAVAASELVVTVLLDHPAVREVLGGATAGLAGRTVLNLSSGTPEQAAELAAWVTDQGGAFLAGAVLAVPQTLGTSEAFTQVSGDTVAFERYRATLDRLGTVRYAGAAPELASAYDVAVLAGMYGMFAGFFQSLALAEASGITGAEITELLVPWLAGAAAVLPLFAGEADAREYATETSNLDINRAGLAAILDSGRARGVSDDLLAPLLARLDQQVTDGHGEKSLSRVVESFRTGTGETVRA
ncbi:3-hydroxyisobutyrate dehydrogenase-like beta-hydroxyacid dehydrogenase [Nocardiopsis sp. Huas11]|uniref:NAD(P)-dependent oxidoreductase n=1 Tax=Nocardiopsis sp. Huas11 TaxID=2183912 RepID=UPI000EB5CEC1|nr:NAD(P)-binding domain-containing protein [Nocardiopsis sp. Huas11]RKS08081.1 3-hydroxyisobutyrate dehydrogenase-like beta-hydroxyacid dehydrogenase [Nocardiopsis sp. Huas11]